MTTSKLSTNKICTLAGIGFAVTSAILLAVLYFVTDNVMVLIGGLLFISFGFIWAISFILLIRKMLIRFSTAICKTLDDMLNGDAEPSHIAHEENLLYKINHRLVRLYEVMRESRRRTAEEKAALQELVSDISHQVKMPIANLKMVNATLLEQNVSAEKRREFLQAISVQLDKLDFLMQAMIKTSRLEAGVIALEKKEQPIYDALAAALGGILLNAEKKDINVKVHCPEYLTVPHDRKWTSEALFNILDNAVKYTPATGNISISVEGWEMYLKIDVTDTGKGISESHQAEIFKRFYREEEVHDIEGIGIGLYLAREIITMQGGYINVASKVGQGSTFSVFLPSKMGSSQISQDCDI